MLTYKIHLLRHGLTRANLEGRYIGRTDLPLCPEGRAQLEKLRDTCEYPWAERVYTSPLLRARQTAELLQGLHSRGVRLGIVSTKTGETISRIMERFGLRDTLELILGSYDVTHHKPHPEGILKALDQMGVAPEELLYCGDTILDAQAAQGAGVDFAAVLNGTTQAPAFAPYPCVHIAPDLTELAQWLEGRA